MKFQSQLSPKKLLLKLKSTLPRQIQQSQMGLFNFQESQMGPQDLHQ